MAEPGAIGRHYADAPAEELLAAGSYQDAAERAREARYAEAETLLAAGDLRGAALSFGNAAGYRDARERSFAAWNGAAVRNTISSGNEHAVGLRADGTVVAAGKNDRGQCDAGGWSDIIAVSTKVFHTVGLKADGTVVIDRPKEIRMEEIWTGIKMPNG